ncbi:hypothetical protein Nmel_016445 [Mimus melanotis]
MTGQGYVRAKRRKILHPQTAESPLGSSVSSCSLSPSCLRGSGGVGIPWMLAQDNCHSSATWVCPGSAWPQEVPVRLPSLLCFWCPPLPCAARVEQPGQAGLFWLPVLAEQPGTGPCRNAYCWVTFQPSAPGGCAGFPCAGRRKGGDCWSWHRCVHGCAEACWMSEAD